MSSLTTSLSISPKATNKKLPILLFDVMDTIVRDPFYHHIPNFFRMSMKELLDSKHPTAWIEFEKGLIDEMELTRKFFKDGRYFDIEGLKNCVQEGYSYIDGVEELLHDLKKNGYEIHAFTNYPIWYVQTTNTLKNVEAAIEAGFSGIHFKNAETLGKELSLLGINLLKDE
ncbi:hypothetical protein Leryth_022257 [Lithospermum erythrorhizon]|nr:hypothetical protein Leryth_022257 [Lithospermum erythrorhizon]